jgi:antitoxin HicB
MYLAYPFDIRLVEEEGKSYYIAQSSDVPEALTQGQTLDEVISRAQEALALALSFYVEAGEVIPQPSKTIKNQELVPLHVNEAAKLVLYESLKEKGMSKAELARQLGIQHNQVYRLLDLKISSHFSTLERALNLLGKRVGLFLY